MMQRSYFFPWQENEDMKIFVEWILSNLLLQKGMLLFFLNNSFIYLFEILAYNL